MSYITSLHGPARGRWMGACGALYAAAAVALSAYATHAVQGDARSQLQTAALFAFGHGIALTALAPVTRDLLGRLALLAVWLGVLLFSGSVVGNVLLQWPATLAPSGGMLLIAGWLLFALDLLRR